MPTTERFTWADVEKFPHHVLVTKESLEAYEVNPAGLQQTIFVTKIDGVRQAFKMLCFLTMGEQKVFYLLFADDDNEAIGYSGSAFFELLVGSHKVY
jgi:hypothetical protein